ncbi:MAG: sulfatase-like hydrolase/transferase, partial [Planctomycetota bacterium]
MSARNILLLCADQFRGDMLAANGLNADIRTPNLDALAGRGVRFGRHFTTFPKCVPARISMMTGRHTHTDGYRDITRHLPADKPDLASTLKRHGYQLVELGRNHCWENMLEATHRPPQLAPGQRGLAFDHHAWTPPFAEIWERHKAGESAIERVEPDTLEDGRGFVFKDERGWAADHAVVEMADLFLREVRDRGRPFFCQVNLGKPHTPYEVGPPWFGMYDRGAIERLPHELPSDAPMCAERQRAVWTGHDCPTQTFAAIQSTYMGMCSRVDALLGQVIESLERTGLWDETLIVFTSDHGDYAGQYGLVEKWDTHFPDALMHVPMVMAGGGMRE